MVWIDVVHSNYKFKWEQWLNNYIVKYNCLMTAAVLVTASINKCNILFVLLLSKQSITKYSTDISHRFIYLIPSIIFTASNPLIIAESLA